MKTALRLIEYEKELNTKEVYSLVALACYYNNCFKECSKAFVKLERMTGISDQEKLAYESIALAIFSRHSPQDISA
jgi:WD repeat-containing protein 35